MELSQLKQFIIAAETENFTVASQLLFVSQPSLSRKIAGLESELDIQLFDRQGRSVVLNESGKIVLKYAKKIFADIDDMNNELLSVKDIISEALIIGVVSYVGSIPDWLDSSIKWFMDLYPHIRLSLQNVDSGSLCSSFSLIKIDFAISFLSQIDYAEGVAAIPICTEQIGLTMSKDYHLAARESLSIADLKDESFLLNGGDRAVQPHDCLR